MSNYNFPQPPPPPPSGGPPGHGGYQQPPPQYGYQQHMPQGQGHPRGGSFQRGGARGGHQGASPYPQANGYAPQGFQQGPQQPLGGVYNPQQPYLGPQGPPQGQGPPQWQGNNGQHLQHGPQQHQQHGPQQHGPPQHLVQHGPPMNGPQQPQIQPPPQAAPLQPQNYHPNYAPQAYQPQFNTQQPPQFQQPSAPVVPYGPPQPAAPQWSGPPQHAMQPQFNNRGRGGGGPSPRGGFTGSRGNHTNAPLMGPPIRMGFNNGGQAQASPFPVMQFVPQQSPPAPFVQPTAYQPYQPQPFSQDRTPLDQNPYNSQRGRGNSNFRGQGRGNGNFQQFRNPRDNRHNGGSGSSRNPSDSFRKSPAGAEQNNSGKKHKKKRRTNTLGLTPGGADHESEDELDDVDEETRLVTLLGQDVPHEPADLVAFLAERKANFPTKARREAALLQAQEEHRQRSERRADKNKNRNSQNKSAKKENGESKAPETKLEKEQRRAEKLRSDLAKSERRQNAMIQGGKRKRENGDEGDDVRDQVSDGDSDDSSASDDSDGEPDAMSSRSTGPQHVSQPPKTQLQRHCKYFSTGGTCGKKGKCRFVHDQEVRNQALSDKEANGGKMTLAQRLILNDTAKDDLTILKSIKYLKEKGLLKEPNGSANRDSSVKSEDNGYGNMDYGDDGDAT